jgi:hypothetical protein
MSSWVHLVGAVKHTRIVGAFVAPPRVVPVSVNLTAVPQQRLCCALCCHVPTGCIIPEATVKLVQTKVVHVDSKSPNCPANALRSIVRAWLEVGSHGQACSIVDSPKEVHKGNICMVQEVCLSRGACMSHRHNAHTHICKDAPETSLLLCPLAKDMDLLAPTPLAGVLAIPTACTCAS